MMMRQQTGTTRAVVWPLRSSHRPGQGWRSGATSHQMRARPAVGRQQRGRLLPATLPGKTAPAPRPPDRPELLLVLYSYEYCPALPCPACLACLEGWC